MGFSGSKWLLISFTWLHKSWTGFYLILLCFTGFSLALGGSSFCLQKKQDFDGILLDFTGFLPGLSGF